MAHMVRAVLVMIASFVRARSRGRPGHGHEGRDD
jgi:hypothetical protein